MIQQTQIELPLEGVPTSYFTQLLPLPVPVRGVVFAYAKHTDDPYTPVKRVQKYVGANVTGLPDENTCFLLQEVLRSKGVNRVTREIVDSLLGGHEGDALLKKNLLQFKPIYN